MLRSLLLILLGFSAIVMDDASNALLAQDSYPRVYGPTGRPYGPTQAHYQYERQYGRPWYGGPAPHNANTGANFHIHGGWGGFPGYGGFYIGNPFGGVTYGYPQQGYALGLPGYNGGYAAYQNQYYGPIQQYQVIPQQVLPQFGPAPVFSWQQPDPFQQQFQQPQQQAQPQQQPAPGRAGENVANNGPVGAPEPLMARPHAFMPAEPSTVAQRQKSLHLQGQGDVWFRQQNFLQAYSRYKQAAGAAPDLAAPHFRMAYALMALQRFELAGPELQRGIKLDPQYPLRGESPQQVYGEENRLAAAALPQTVAAWVRQDIRSPDRLFLLGALLMISGDQARAKILLETAAEFGGPTEHVMAFLRLGRQPLAGPPQPVPPDDRPPVPEAVEKMLKENKDWLPARPLATVPSTEPKGLTVPEPPLPAQDVKRQESPEPTVESPEPASPVIPTEAKKKAPVAPGYVPIPKKGSAAKPAEETAPDTVQPAGGKTSEDESGPVIPIPGAGNQG